MESKTRINRFLASAGVGSRRNCEELIREGRVQVNGETVTLLASFIDADTDQVTVDGSAVGLPSGHTVLVLDKPGGVLSTVRDDRGRKTVLDIAREAGYEERLFPVGRLDMDTTGFILITNDGALAYRMTHPRYKVEKTYVVTVEGAVQEKTIEEIASGVDLGDYVTRPCRLRILERGTERSVLEIILKEGRKRQVKRMFADSGHTVLQLRRTAIAGIEFEGLEPGGIRPLTVEEESRIRELTGLN
jgi:pseudouridine synthase